MSFFSELHTASTTITGDHPSILIRHFGIPAILESSAPIDYQVQDRTPFEGPEQESDGDNELFGESFSIGPGDFDTGDNPPEEDDDDLVSGYVDGGNEAGDFQEPSVEENEDPVCVCGVHRSEHKLCGCGEGFQTPREWEREKQFIQALDEDDYDRIYHSSGY